LQKILISSFGLFALQDLFKELQGKKWQDAPAPLFDELQKSVNKKCCEKFQPLQDCIILYQGVFAFKGLRINSKFGFFHFTFYVFRHCN